MLLHQQRAAARGLLSPEQMAEYNNDTSGSPRSGGVMFSSAPALSSTTSTSTSTSTPPLSPVAAAGRSSDSLLPPAAGGAGGAGVVGGNGRKSLALMMGHLNKLNYGSSGMKKGAGNGNETPTKEPVRDNDGAIVEEVRFDLRACVVPQLTLTHSATASSASSSSTTATSTSTTSSPENSNTNSPAFPLGLHHTSPLTTSDPTSSPTPGATLSIEDGGSMAALLEQIQKLAIEAMPRRKTLAAGDVGAASSPQSSAHSSPQLTHPATTLTHHLTSSPSTPHTPAPPFQKKVYKAHTTMRVVTDLNNTTSTEDNSTSKNNNSTPVTKRASGKKGGSKRGGGAIGKSRESGDSVMSDDPRRVRKTPALALGSLEPRDAGPAGSGLLSPRGTDVMYVPLTVELMEKEATYDPQHPSKNRSFTFIPPYGLCEVQLRIIVVDERKMAAARQQAEAEQKRKEYEEKRRKKELKQMRHEDEASMQMDMMVVEVVRGPAKLTDVADQADDEEEKLIVERFLAEARKRQQARSPQRTNEPSSNARERDRERRKESGSSVGSLATLVGKERITKKEKTAATVSGATGGGSRITGLDLTNLKKGLNSGGIPSPGSPLMTKSDEHRATRDARKMSDFGLDSGDFGLDHGNNNSNNNTKGGEGAGEVDTSKLGSQLKKVRNTKNRASVELLSLLPITSTKSGGKHGNSSKEARRRTESDLSHIGSSPLISKKDKKEKDKKEKKNKKKDSQRDRELRALIASASSSTSDDEQQQQATTSSSKSQSLLSFVSGSVISPRMVSLNGNKDRDNASGKSNKKEHSKDKSHDKDKSKDKGSTMDGSSSAKKKKKVRSRASTSGSASKSLIAGPVLLRPPGTTPLSPQLKRGKAGSKEA
eukprot:TRINITY_DN958_c0_g1_i2.p1 TRINITY_DN958_c0_g1~~TRINITY_DN958_c0_g1_i2.p1  ORF type:complete len:879 (+),score=266.74 TRINITY_DN958_c0_g1_i2:343-2979(+)